MISLEYFLGSFLTILTVFFISKINKNVSNSNRSFKFSQSHIFELTKPYQKPIVKNHTRRQSDIHYDKTNIKVLIMEDKAFWIKNNAIYTAAVDGDEVIKSSAEQVDIMGMDKVELDKMIFIVDQLTERQKHDRRNPGVE